MAIEQGISLLVRNALSNPPDDAFGGFFAQLPKDWISADRPRAWTYRFITSNPMYVLAGANGMVEAELQIDCHGFTPEDAIALAAAIDPVLSGFHGLLPDDDQTKVQGMFNQGSSTDGYSDVNRTFVRTLEYQIHYAAS
ncbi:MAG TPA: hypothetical protein VNH83_18895 [Bryobacteraceae bacterium]|nr:hypothetical protein [Bryobacteraceae bacterium]